MPPTQNDVNVYVWVGFLSGGTGDEFSFLAYSLDEEVIVSLIIISIHPSLQFQRKANHLAATHDEAGGMAAYRIIFILRSLLSSCSVQLLFR